MSYYTNYWDSDQKQREIKRLQDEVEDLRYQREQEQERQRREAREQREERKHEWEERQLYADNWPDGFNKGIYRARQEAREEEAMNAKFKNDPDFAKYASDLDDFFNEWATKLEKSRDIYNEEMRAAEIVIQKYRQSVLNRIANRVEAEADEPDLADAMRNDNPNYLTNW